MHQAHCQSPSIVFSFNQNHNALDTIDLSDEVDGLLGDFFSRVPQ